MSSWTLKTEGKPKQFIVSSVKQKYQDAGSLLANSLAKYIVLTLRL